jgi:hypothetical protein
MGHAIAEMMIRYSADCALESSENLWSGDFFAPWSFKEIISEAHLIFFATVAF